MKYLQTSRKICILALTILAVIPASEIVAQVMEGTIYKMESDTINFGGGASSSTNYMEEGTLGEVGTGPSDGTAYNMNAGFWQVSEGSYISMSAASDISLSSISGLVGGSSEGTASWTVTTDSPAGYTMTVQSSTSPALTSGADSFADYTPSGSDPDYNFTIGSTESEFGFTPEGADITATYKDNGSACNTGSGDTSGKCWTNFTTTPKTIINRTTTNHPSGTTNTIRVRAEAGTDRMQPAGAYSAQITVTATML